VQAGGRGGRQRLPRRGDHGKEGRQGGRDEGPAQHPDTGVIGCEEHYQGLAPTEERPMRTMLFVCAFALLAASARAAEYRGNVRKVDVNQNRLTLGFGGKEITFKVPATAKVTIQIAMGTIEPKDKLMNPWFK